MPQRVRSLTLIEPILFCLREARGKRDEYLKIGAVADRVIRYVDAGDSEEAARGFLQ